MALEDIYNWHEALASLCNLKAERWKVLELPVRKDNTAPWPVVLGTQKREQCSHLQPLSWVLPARDNGEGNVNQGPGPQKVYSAALGVTKNPREQVESSAIFETVQQDGKTQRGPPLPHAPTALQACNMRAYWWLYPLNNIFNIIVSILIVLQLQI